MHCPNCRLTNASTTRFCTGCGAVLVESAPGGGRRRVLRPWGLQRRAPPTESPAMPDVVAALAAARGARGARGWPARKIGVFFASGVAVTAVAGTLVYPYTTSHEPAKSEPPVVLVETALSLPAVREVRLSAPALAEPLVAPPRARPGNNGARMKPALIAPLSVPEPQAAPVDSPVVEAATPAPAAPVAAPPPPVDRLEPLRDALRGCGAADGLFNRAMCEQRARIDHCGGYWGTVPLCPSGRNEHTQ